MPRNIIDQNQSLVDEENHPCENHNVDMEMDVTTPSVGKTP